MNRQRLTSWWFAGTLLFALLLMLVPLPALLEPFKPYWPALVLLYWALESEDRVGLGLAFLVGLGADLFDGALLGEQALRLTALAFIALRFRSRLRFFPMWQQTLAVLALLLNDRILLLMVRVLSGAPVPPADWWISPFVGAALWPFLFLLLDDLRLRFRLQ
ncbi:rod shape-determining protein MreD [Rhodanobacter sp. DHG33]|uniref:rod shape-determining protein MreD n=1 Tax=Rhodanobacter sp. DHG33 TaxID=2775921 RepID=UPI001780881A|nr:rod shape-determining protein MreD [Rhodanobacter sp. DHG33]MBD8900219.1 rod shape-determining protein MreD [Rhodanobacter sp. DHG33]